MYLAKCHRVGIRLATSNTTNAAVGVQVAGPVLERILTTAAGEGDDEDLRRRLWRALFLGRRRRCYFVGGVGGVGGMSKRWRQHSGEHLIRVKHVHTATRHTFTLTASRARDHVHQEQWIEGGRTGGRWLAAAGAPARVQSGQKVVGSADDGGAAVAAEVNNDEAAATTTMAAAADSLMEAGEPGLWVGACLLRTGRSEDLSLMPSLLRLRASFQMDKCRRIINKQRQRQHQQPCITRRRTCSIHRRRRRRRGRPPPRLRERRASFHFPSTELSFLRPRAKFEIIRFRLMGRRSDDDEDHGSSSSPE